MKILVGDTIVDEDLTYEEKPLTIQDRDLTTFAYQLRQTITDSKQTKVITKHVPKTKPSPWCCTS
jgi:hypothetical protein